MMVMMMMVVVVVVMIRQAFQNDADCTMK